MKKREREALENQIKGIANNPKLTLNERRKKLRELSAQAKTSGNHIAVSIIGKALNNPNIFKQELLASQRR